MSHRIVAERIPESGVLKEWHMARGDQEQAMCGRDLVANAEEMSEDAWGTERARPFCHTCGAIYLREVP
ncbi:hypothetical protein ACFYVL_34285 [Streptomyces sp. NPDC004111]|uniref:hypothetical protein n=1 Tax=Streptomyces sp. NPDC004111 TaxID=3364690 RepID=UPI0036CF7F61